MNLLTRTVLEDLIKMDMILYVMSLETHTEIEKDLDEIKPAEIIGKITGVDSNTIGHLLYDVYEKKLTISEAIEKLQEESELMKL